MFVYTSGYTGAVQRIPNKQVFLQERHHTEISIELQVLVLVLVLR